MNLSPTDWLTLALVVITGLYAWATFRILRANEAVVAAMKEQTETQLRPYLIVSAAPRIGTTLMCLHIENAGRSVAENIRLKMDRDFYPHAERREHEGGRHGSDKEWFHAFPVGHATLPCGGGGARGKTNDKPILSKRE